MTITRPVTSPLTRSLTAAVTAGGGGSLLRKIGLKSLNGYWGTMTTPGYDGRTMQTITVAESHFNAVRLIIRNAEATSYTLNAAAVSASATASGVNPSTGLTGWLPVTWSGATSVVVPARIAASRPSVVVSDWIPLASIARSDGGTLPVIYLRGYNATGPKTGMVGSTINPTNWRTVSGDPKTLNRFIITDSAIGDFASTNRGGMSSDSGTFSTFLNEFEYRATGEVLTVMGVGDSITQGDGGSIPMLSWGHTACATVTTAANPVQWANHGASNQTSANFLARVQDMIAAGRRPQVLVFTPASPNDGTPDATVLTGWRNVLSSMLALCDANGIIPIVWTTIPRAWAAGPDAFRQTINTEIRALAGSGRYVADFDAAIASSPGAATINASYTGDSIHPNDAGNGVLSDVLETVLSNVIAAYY